MREIDVKEITTTVARLCQEANYYLPDDVLSALEKAYMIEESPLGKETVQKIIENARIARNENIPVCQDCGVTLVYIEIGQNIKITGGNLNDAIQEGVRKGYKEGFLRKSMVEKPFSERKNTEDNTPAVIHSDIVPGNKLKITIMPKGAGSENMSRLVMLNPSAGRQGIIDSVVKAVEEAGSNPCPPIIVGIGIGGTAEKAMDLAKRALIRTVGEPSPDFEAAQLENEILNLINKTGIGPQGFGGKITALAVHIETFTCHIGSLPLAINIQCHALRRKTAIL